MRSNNKIGNSIKRIFLTPAIGFTICCSLYGQKEQKAIDILKQSAGILEKNNFFEYKASYRVKYFDNKDTTLIQKYECHILRKPEDTILGYYARLSGPQPDERIYDGINFYLIFPAIKKIIKDNPVITGKGFARNNIQRQYVPSFLYSPTPFKSWINDAREIRIKEEANVNSHKCWVIEISMPTDEEITQSIFYLYIDEKTFVPRKQVYKAKYKDIQDQYSELFIDELKMSSSNISDFTNHYIYPKGYIEEVYKAPNIDYSLLPNGSDAIPFSLKGMDGKVYTLEELSKEYRLILIDFWYLACPPCLSAMPSLIELYDKYKSKGLLILGLNSVDLSEERQNLIKKFVVKMKINYPLLVSSTDFDKAYLVKSYPTLYVLKKGKVVYSHRGFSEEDMSELEKIISDEIEK